MDASQDFKINDFETVQVGRRLGQGLEQGLGHGLEG